MPNALIYSPDLDGHRQVHVFVYANILSELGFNVYAAGNLKQSVTNSFYIDKLKNILGPRFIDTSVFTDGGYNVTRDEFAGLQDSCKTDLTVFTEADNHLSLLVSQIFNKNRLRGKTAGLFLRPFYYYEEAGFYDKLRYIKHLPSRWKTDDKLFHEVLLRKFSLLDVAFYLDENFVAHHRKATWVPDVYQSYAELIVKDESSQQRSWIEKLNKFREQNHGRFIFFYFGTAQLRRGYDTLLKMAVDHQGCFIHCGLINSKEKFRYDTEALRSSLQKSGSILETNQYIEDPVCIEHFFKSVSHLILPYRNFYGSSGVMLQAMALGIPVLAPENGIIGYSINKHSLGMTYDEKDPLSLDARFESFIKTDPESYVEKIKTYMYNQSAQHLKSVLVNSFK